MKSIVIYFSQSGNTRKVARAIQKGISQLLEQCEIAELKKVNPQDLSNYDLIGLGSPIYMSCVEPRNVRDFINSIPYSKGKHIFCFNTHDAFWKWYFSSVTRRLIARGFTVIGMRDWFGCVNVQCFPSPWYTDGHPDETDLREAEEFGKEMVEVSRRISAGETHLIPPELPPINQIPMRRSRAVRPGRSLHGTIKYNKEKCLYPECHLCVDNCPFKYIDLDNPPLFGDRPLEGWCENGCTFCELICPTGAITGDFEYGLEVCRENKEDFEVIFAEAEAEGHFRRLVPLDKIGWDTPYYKVHNKRPRYVIKDK